MAGLMITVTLVAVLLGLSVLFGGFVGAIFAALVWCVLPTPLVICAVYGRRNLQAFAIGGLIPWGLFVMRIPPLTTFLPMTIWLVALGGVCGTVAVVTRRWLERSGGE